MARTGNSGRKAKKVVIIGATSGIGRALAYLFLNENPDNVVGVTGRRTEELADLQGQFPGRVFYRTMDVTREDSVEQTRELISEMGGADIIIYSAGVGSQNSGPEMRPETEMPAVFTNTVGFSRIIMFAYNYFRTVGGGQFVTIASVAGVRPLRHSPAYSATKRYQIHYTSCLAQLAHKNGEPIRFTTILPGFIQTGLLKHKYPFVISLDKGARLIYKAIKKKKRRAIVPGRWRIIVFLWRLIPLWEKF